MENVKTSVAQLEVSAGMAYAIQLSDGRFIMIDGGEHFDVDGERILRYLREKAQGEKPVIAAWFFTHGHSDHIQLAARFMVEYKNEVEIEKIAYNIPTNIEYNGYDKTSKRNNDESEAMWFQAVEAYPNENLHILRTGDEFTIDNVKVNVLTTAFDKYPDPPTNRNHTSAVMKFTFSCGTSFLAFGDAGGERLFNLIEQGSPIYCSDEMLKSDIMQVPHHGLKVVHADGYDKVLALYRKVAPKICFWPQKATRFYNDKLCQDEQYSYNRFLLDSVKDKNFHQTQTVVVEMEDLHITLWK